MQMLISFRGMGAHLIRTAQTHKDFPFFSTDVFALLCKMKLHQSPNSLRYSKMQRGCRLNRWTYAVFEFILCKKREIPGLKYGKKYFYGEFELVGHGMYFTSSACDRPPQTCASFVGKRRQAFPQRRGNVRVKGESAHLMFSLLAKL